MSANNANTANGVGTWRTWFRSLGYDDIQTATRYTDAHVRYYQSSPYCALFWELHANRGIKFEVTPTLTDLIAIFSLDRIGVYPHTLRACRTVECARGRTPLLPRIAVSQEFLC